MLEKSPFSLNKDNPQYNGTFTWQESSFERRTDIEVLTLVINIVFHWQFKVCTVRGRLFVTVKNYKKKTIIESILSQKLSSALRQLWKAENLCIVATLRVKTFVGRIFSRRISFCERYCQKSDLQGPQTGWIFAFSRLGVESTLPQIKIGLKLVITSI